MVNEVTGPSLAKKQRTVSISESSEVDIKELPDKI